jgi:hypothetical protein
MNLRLARAIAKAENANDLHLARLLILLQAVAQLSEREEFADLSLRSHLVVKAVGGLSARREQPVWA